VSDVVKHVFDAVSRLECLNNQLIINCYYQSC